MTVHSKDDDQSVPQITIRRDWLRHRWVYTECGAHGIATPWVDDAPADMVVRWLKTSANGRLHVRVDLS